jgi:hypothetical protein
MNIDLYNLFLTDGIRVLFILAFLFFGKNLIEYFFKQTIELKKSELTQNLENHKTLIDQENLIFKHKLDTNLNESNIQYSKLHADRGEIIKKFYAKLVKLNSSMEVLTHPMKTHSIIQSFDEYETDLRKRASKSYNSLNDFYQKNKIFFQPDTTKVIDKILNVFKTAYIDYNDYSEMVKGRIVEDGEIIKSRKKMKDAYISVKNEIPEVKKKLEDEFRELLGVKNP